MKIPGWLLDQLTDTIIDLYGDPESFVEAYNKDADEVFHRFVSKLTVVPIDLKVRLEETYVSITSHPDGRASA